MGAVQLITPRDGDAAEIPIAVREAIVFLGVAGKRRIFGLSERRFPISI